ncbi:hypothetical protein [Faecalibacterium prausnitzii]|jgi:hypothetical protein|uniref:hypothetical protein n=1 Tax=Faecalibacterium prausnitzii TaxID=853 RepID=UPI001CBB8FB6|nr:hypothetical protein [Faecalibacterium prausnitzii]
MMMPANFSAVSENEMTYVMGGSVADYLAPAMGAAQWQNFHKNLITIVGNKYVQGFLDNTVGAMFSGAWVPGNGLKGFGGQFSAIWDANYTKKLGDDTTGLQKAGYGALGVVNCALNVVGNLAAIYNLGFGTAKNIVNDTKFNFV